ncbi:type IV pilus modification PilV family protein [Thiocystis violascens]|uniref:Tfp pilus assembly protein PilV n=1 Tax=Thiocystis violascens (strain ATCC 17096 / DSM 198 / 6111) TaxID=765911 RepID=I3YAY7_THIV6|nr:Tfp pilus assembly protein PilV [Thiocystis violascens]AFL74155.1 Tfp pilus assembly protein PilV [Thiocystis violascens DSM 198]
MLGQIKGKQRGFSLDEALISLAVLSSGLLSLAQFQGQMHENSSQTKTQTTAVNLAQQKLEALRALASTDYSGIVDSQDTPPTHPGDNTSFSRRWSVASHASPAYKEVSVTTDWQAFDGTAQAVTISSFLAPGAPYTGTLNPPPASGGTTED